MTPSPPHGTLVSTVAEKHSRFMAEWRIRKLPERIKKSLKLWAVQDDVSMNALIIRLLTEAVNTRN